MINGTTYVLIAILLISVIAAIYLIVSDSAVSASVAEDMAKDAAQDLTKPGLELVEGDVIRGADESSVLTPIGWVLIALGVAFATWAWAAMDITPVKYSDTVNIDAVSQRGMAHTFGLAIALAGAVLACTGHVVNEVRRGR